MSSRKGKQVCGGDVYKEDEKGKEKEVCPNVCDQLPPVCPPCPEVYDRNYSQYYDTPDGCDTFTKMAVAARYGIVAGLVAGTFDVMMYSHAVGMASMLRRYAIHVIPLGLMGATFAAVANNLVCLRRADDELNYFLGGVACSPILAAYVGTMNALVPGAVALGLAAMAKKTAIKHGHRFLPQSTPHMGMADSWRNDYTLAHDPLCDCVYPPVSQTHETCHK